MPSSKSLRYTDITNCIEKMSLTSFKNLIAHYAENHKVSLDNELNWLTMADFQKRLEAFRGV